MRDWAQPVWECPASSEGRTSAELVPLHPGPPTWAREPPAPSPGAPSPVPSGPQPRIHQKPALCSLTARQAACSTAPPPGLGQRCTTRTQSQVLPLGLYSPGPSGTLHNPTRGTAASTPDLGFLRSPGVGVGGSGFGACSLRSRFLDNPSPLLSSSRNPCHWEEAPGPESSP